MKAMLDARLKQAETVGNQRKAKRSPSASPARN